MFTSIPTALGLMSRSEKTKFFFLLSVRALSGFLDVLGIALIGLVAGLASTAFKPGQELTILGITLPEVNETLLVSLVVGVLFLFAVKALIAVSLGKAMTIFLAKIETEKSLEIVRHLFGGDLNRVQAFSKGHILWSVTGSVNLAFAGVLMALTTLVSEGLLLLLIATTFAFVDPIATLFVILYFGIVIFGLQLVIAQSLKKAGREASDGSVESTVAIDDLISAFREATVLGKTQYFVEKFYLARSKLSRANASLIFLSGMPRYVVETALMLGVVIFVGFQFVSGQLAEGFVTVGVFLTGGVRIMASLLPLQAAVANLKSQGEQAKSALGFLTDGENKAKEVNRTFHKPSSSVLEHETFSPLGVEIRELTYFYDDSEFPALSDINLTITPGQHVAIIGPSGSGKTTLVDAILGLLQPDTGLITYWDDQGKERNLDSLPGKVSYVPQKPGMVSGTIAQNVALGTPQHQIDPTRVLEALTKADLADFVLSLPEGINTSIGAQSDALSGGQIQRLGLARALYQRPVMIVLDEATSALDASSEAAVTNGLKQFGTDVTVIVIAHRLSTVQHSDNVFVLENGKISASGKFAQLKKTVPMVAEYVRLMSFED